MSSKNQVTLPVDALADAGLRTGDELRVVATGTGTLLLTRVDDALDRFAGALDGVFPPDAIDELRAEWD